MFITKKMDTLIQTAVHSSNILLSKQGINKMVRSHRCDIEPKEIRKKEYINIMHI